jgi:hypothetical protein
VSSYAAMLTTPLAGRFPTFSKIISVNSSSAGWASPALSNFRDNIFLNNSGGNICLLFSYHPPNNQLCDEALARDPRYSQYVISFIVSRFASRCDEEAHVGAHRSRLRSYQHLPGGW